MHLLNTLIFWVCTIFLPPSEENIARSYVDQYKDLAIIEMQRTGVPASIKLAQAILESNSGTSTFSQSSNNHFGIKCKSYWKGEKYYHKDDDLNDAGQLIKSCFRSYESVLDSYVDHSHFLKNSPYYGQLFDVAGADYIDWARGLQHYGYATDPAYAEKLIRIIERHDLQLLDE